MTQSFSRNLFLVSHRYLLFRVICKFNFFFFDRLFSVRTEKMRSREVLLKFYVDRAKKVIVSKIEITPEKMFRQTNKPPSLR